VTTPPPGYLDDRPSWTPDGGRIVFGREPVPEGDTRRDLWTIRPDGTGARLLLPACVEGPPRCVINGEMHLYATYSPDGRQVAYQLGGGDVREDIGQLQMSEVYVMNADGTDRHALTAINRDTPYQADVGSQSWSPDSRRLVFHRHNSAVGTPANGTALFMINRDGSGMRPVTPWDLRAGGRAAWFPGGRTIAFRTLPPDDAPGGDIYTIGVDGTGLRLVRHFGPEVGLGELDVSPDGRQIVFSMGPDKRDLFVMRSDGTHLRQITSTALSENWPDWRPFS
jgi:TolB protein